LWFSAPATDPIAAGLARRICEVPTEAQRRPATKNHP
jgi:hypothetical protein